ncbi:MAG: lipoyl synthase [Actinomycetia bacterium]|nr:lipoyl synthase [Actinomycetes bacterium]MCP4959709.1 lipoyl synthase [Actinomycetes bacterium]
MLRQRWLGRVPYVEALDLQMGLYRGNLDHLLLLEHPHVYTLGASANADHVLVDPAEVGAELHRASRGGDVTYHGPGQLVGYPILSVAGRRGGGMADTVKYVRGVEQLLIDVLTDLGIAGTGRLAGYPGVWVDPEGPRPRKIAAIGVRLSRGRSMHGFALNVAPDMTMFDHIVPCGIEGLGVTSLEAEGLSVEMAAAVDAVFERAAVVWGADGVERLDVTERVATGDLAPFTRGLGAGAVVAPDDHMSVETRVEPDGGTVVEGLTIKKRVPGSRMAKRLSEAGVDGGLEIATRKPEWLKARVDMGHRFRHLKRTVRSFDLSTVCEEASCPNIFECWGEGTATFLINGERCTRACGYCHVDTSRPEPLDAGEPERVAAAVDQMGLTHVVITAVARDDLSDGGAAAFAATVDAIRGRAPTASVEVLISDCRGDRAALDVVFDAKPDVMNHNLETVARLQRAVRPSAGYARSLAVLARAKAAGLITKSGLIVGMGETAAEVGASLADLAGVGCDIVTIGQYLRPTTNHLPVHRWVEPSEFAGYVEIGESLGIGHVESSPLTRSSYRAGAAANKL